jgi:hypothetical protein
MSTFLLVAAAFCCFALGFILCFALAVWRGQTLTKKQKYSSSRHRDLQMAIIDVQDAVALNFYYPTTDTAILKERLDELRMLQQARDYALHVYYGDVS